MSRKSNKRHQIVRSKSKEASATTAISPDLLISQQRYTEAIKVLRSRIISNQSDNDIRMLVECYVHTNMLSEAIHSIDGIKEKIAYDYAMLGWCYIQSENPELAIPCMTRSIELEETAEKWYWLAVAKRDKAVTERSFEDNFREAVSEALSKAIVLPNCREDAFVMLYQYWPSEDSEGKLNILTNGLDIHPTSVSIRYELASYLHRTNQSNEALNILLPSLNEDCFSPKNYWLAYDINAAISKYDIALECLSTIDKLTSDNKEGLYIAIGDLLVNTGKKIDAIKFFYQEIDLSNERSSFAALVKITAILIEESNFETINEVIAQLRTEINRTDDCFYDFRYYVSWQYSPFDMKYYGNEVAIVTSMILKKVNTLTNEEEGILRLINYLTDWQGSDRETMLFGAHKVFEHPLVSIKLSEYYLDKNETVEAVYYHLLSAIQLYKSVGAPNGYDYGELYFHVEDLDIPLCKKIGSTSHTLMIANNYSELCEGAFTSFYTTCLRDIMFRVKSFKELSDVASLLLAVDDCNSSLWFDYAYALQQIKQSDIAENAYQKVLEISPDSAGALNNLALIKKDKELYDEALCLADRAIALEPSNRNYQQLRSDIITLMDKLRTEDKHIRTAPDRWPSIHQSEKRLLGVLSQLGGSARSVDEVFEYAGIQEKYATKNWDNLIQQRMLIPQKDGRWSINPYIARQVELERSHSLITKIIHANKNIIYKPIFNSNNEYVIYNCLLHLFPNHLAFPNMSLQAIFQYDRMKELLSPDEFRYYLMSQVDCCIVSTADYCPIVAFEVDSHYHDKESQIARDEKKNKIFTLGGIPLLRLRTHGQPSENAIKEQLSNDINSLVRGVNLSGLLNQRFQLLSSLLNTNNIEDNDNSVTIDSN